MIGEKLVLAMVFAVEALIAWLYLEHLFNRRTSIFRFCSSFIFGHLVLYLFSLLGSTTANAISFFVINYCLMQINYQCSRRTALLQSAFLCFIMIGAELLVNLFIGAFGYEFAAFTYNLGVMIVLVVLSKLLYLMFSVIGSRIFTPHKYRNEDPGLMILFCGLPIVSALVAIIIAYLGMTSGVTQIVGIMIIMIVVTLLVVNLIILALYNYLQKANEDYLTLQLSIQKEQADIIYYQALQEQYENQRIMVHDIKKHLGTIDAIAKQTGAVEIESYVSSLNESFAPIRQAKLCTDPILNLLLLRFGDSCKQNRIQFLCDVRANVSTFMDAPSVTTLYGNLLSNALEAAVVSEDRVVEISVISNCDQNNIIISVINSCDIAPIPENIGHFRSHKKGPGIHGVGLKSIARIVKKHHGLETMYYDEKNKRFHHIIQFPNSA